MESIIKTYDVRVIREAGEDALTGLSLERGEESFQVDATSARAAFQMSYLVSSLRFTGQLRRTFVDGREYFYDSR